MIGSVAAHWDDCSPLPAVSFSLPACYQQLKKKRGINGCERGSAYPQYFAYPPMRRLHRRTSTQPGEAAACGNNQLRLSARVHRQKNTHTPHPSARISFLKKTKTTKKTFFLPVKGWIGRVVFSHGKNKVNVLGLKWIAPVEVPEPHDIFIWLCRISVLFDSWIWITRRGTERSKISLRLADICSNYLYAVKCHLSLLFLHLTTAKAYIMASCSCL